MINNGFTPDKDDYEFCTKVDNMIIPSEGFFGISAATGGLAGTNLLLKNPKVCVYLFKSIFLCVTLPQSGFWVF